MAGRLGIWELCTCITGPIPNEKGLIHRIMEGAVSRYDFAIVLDSERHQVLLEHKGRRRLGLHISGFDDDESAFRRWMRELRRVGWRYFQAYGSFYEGYTWFTYLSVPDDVSDWVNLETAAGQVCDAWEVEALDSAEEPSPLAELRLSERLDHLKEMVNASNPRWKRSHDGISESGSDGNSEDIDGPMEKSLYEVQLDHWDKVLENNVWSVREIIADSIYWLSEGAGPEERQEASYLIPYLAVVEAYLENFAGTDAVSEWTMGEELGIPLETVKACVDHLARWNRGFYIDDVDDDRIIRYDWRERLVGEQEAQTSRADEALMSAPRTIEDLVTELTKAWRAQLREATIVQTRDLDRLLDRMTTQWMVDSALALIDRHPHEAVHRLRGRPDHKSRGTLQLLIPLEVDGLDRIVELVEQNQEQAADIAVRWIPQRHRPHDISLQHALVAAWNRAGERGWALDLLLEIPADLREPFACFLTAQHYYEQRQFEDMVMWLTRGVERGGWDENALEMVVLTEDLDWEIRASAFRLFWAHYNERLHLEALRQAAEVLINEANDRLLKRQRNMVAELIRCWLDSMEILGTSPVDIGEQMDRHLRALPDDMRFEIYDQWADDVAVVTKCQEWLKTHPHDDSLLGTRIQEMVALRVRSRPEAGDIAPCAINLGPRVKVLVMGLLGPHQQLLRQRVALGRVDWAFIEPGWSENTTSRRINQLCTAVDWIVPVYSRLKHSDTRHLEQYKQKVTHPGGTGVTAVARKIEELVERPLRPS